MRTDTRRFPYLDMILSWPWLAVLAWLLVLHTSAHAQSIPETRPQTPVLPNPEPIRTQEVTNVLRSADWDIHTIHTDVTADPGLQVHIYDPVQRLESVNSQAGNLANLQLALGQSPFADRHGVALDYSRDFVRPGLFGRYDVGFAPRASLAVGPEGSATRLGAVVKFGENLRTPRQQPRNWYLFVGGGAEALTYEPGGGQSIANALRLEDQTIVGDGQAGIAMRMGDAALSLAYIRRENKVYNRLSDLNADNVEDFAGISFTIGR